MLALNGGLHGPYVCCDQCGHKTYLSGNCAAKWGQRFLIPSLTKLGMTVKGPHICKGCKNDETTDRGATERLAADSAAWQVGRLRKRTAT